MGENRCARLDYAFPPNLPVPNVAILSLLNNTCLKLEVTTANASFTVYTRWAAASSSAKAVLYKYCFYNYVTKFAGLAIATANRNYMCS